MRRWLPGRVFAELLFLIQKIQYPTSADRTRIDGADAKSQYVLARQIMTNVREKRLDHHLVEISLAEGFEVSRTLIRAAW